MNTECIICMSNIPEIDNRIKCSHNASFCKDCITKSIINKIDTCAICRAPFQQSVTITVGSIHMTTDRRHTLSHSIESCFLNVVIVGGTYCLIQIVATIFERIGDMCI